MSRTVFRFLSGVWALGTVLASGSSLGAEGGKVALVIGNSAYQNETGLRNPVNDARAVAVSLRSAGFEVLEGLDLSIDQFDQTLDVFERQAAQAAYAVAFYSGHGMQVDGRNWLIPVNAKLERISQLERQAVRVSRLLEALSGASTLGLVILDACRDNKFAERLIHSASGAKSLSVGKGLRRDAVAGNLLVAYATAENETAADGTGANSPYTVALVRHLATPGLDVRLLFGKVRDDVMTETEGRQIPFTYGSLGGSAYVLLPEAARVDPPVSKPADADAYELAFWESIKTSQDAADFEEYLKSYSSGRFAGLARNRLAALRPRVPAPAVPAALPPAPPPAAALARAKELPVALIQTALSGLGLYDGATDGTAGPTTRRAVEAYQRRIGAEASGTLTAEQTVWLIEAAAKGGHAESQNTLGLMLVVGIGLAKDVAAGAGWFRRAADQGLAQAQFNLGKLYRDGQGVAADRTQARRLFAAAAEKGSQGAAAALRELGP